MAASLINSIIDTVIQLAVKNQKRHTGWYRFIRFGSATRTQNFEREVFFYYFSNFPLFLFVKLPDFRSRSLGPAISHCWPLFSPKLRV